MSDTSKLFKLSCKSRLEKIRQSKNPNRRPIVVLDIDNTLLHTLMGDEFNEHDLANKNALYLPDEKWVIYFRPYLKKFMHVLDKYFTIYIWSAGDESYVKRMVAILSCLLNLKHNPNIIYFHYSDCMKSMEIKIDEVLLEEIKMKNKFNYFLSKEENNSEETPVDTDELDSTIDKPKQSIPQYHDFSSDEEHMEPESTEIPEVKDEIEVDTIEPESETVLPSNDVHDSHSDDEHEHVELEDTSDTVLKTDVIDEEVAKNIHNQFSIYRQGNKVVYKNLSYIVDFNNERNCPTSLEDVIIIDDLYNTCLFNKGNSIMVSAYNKNMKDDKTLLELSKTIKSIMESS